jgi:hypothetical protein
VYELRRAKAHEIVHARSVHASTLHPKAILSLALASPSSPTVTDSVMEAAAGGWAAAEGRGREREGGP